MFCRQSATRKTTRFWGRDAKTNAAGDTHRASMEATEVLGNSQEVRYSQGKAWFCSGGQGIRTFFRYQGKYRENRSSEKTCDKSDAGRRRDVDRVAGHYRGFGRRDVDRVAANGKANKRRIPMNASLYKTPRSNKTKGFFGLWSCLWSYEV